MRVWFQIIILSALIGLFGCAHLVSEELRKDLYPTLTFERLLESPEDFIGSPDSDKLVVGNDMSEGKFQSRLLDKKRQSDEMDTQTVMTAEGRPVSIHITQSILMMEVRSIGLGNQITKIESVHFKMNVLMLLPRLNGDQGTLEISPQ